MRILTKEEIETAIEALQENIDLRYAIPICGILQQKVNNFLRYNVITKFENYPFSGYLGFFVSTQNVKHHFSDPDTKSPVTPVDFFGDYCNYIEDDGRSLKKEDLSQEIIEDIEAYSDTRKEVCRVFIKALEEKLHS